MGIDRMPIFLILTKFSSVRQRVCQILFALPLTVKLIQYLIVNCNLKDDRLILGFVMLISLFFIALFTN